MGDDEPRMLLLPGPAGERHGEEIDAEHPEPGDEPGSLVDPGSSHGCIEVGLREGRRSDSDGDRREKNQCQLQRSEQMDQSPEKGSSLTLRDHGRP